MYIYIRSGNLSVSFLIFINMLFSLKSVVVLTLAVTSLVAAHPHHGIPYPAHLLKDSQRPAVPVASAAASPVAARTKLSAYVTDWVREYLRIKPTLMPSL